MLRIKAEKADLLQIALWVAELVLSKDDSRRRAQVVKHLISIADVSSYYVSF